VSGSDDLPGSFFGWLAGVVRKAASDSVARSREYSDHHGHAVSRADEGTEAAPFGDCHAKSTHPACTQRLAATRSVNAHSPVVTDPAG
jgi:hypothetical protein